MEVNKHAIDFYRPISMLSVFSKIFDKFIKKKNSRIDLAFSLIISTDLEKVVVLYFEVNFRNYV